MGFLYRQGNLIFQRWHSGVLKNYFLLKDYTISFHISNVPFSFNVLCLLAGGMCLNPIIILILVGYVISIGNIDTANTYNSETVGAKISIKHLESWQ